MVALTANLSIRVTRLSLISARNRITNTHSVIDTTNVADGSSTASGVKLNTLLAQLPKLQYKNEKCTYTDTLDGLADTSVVTSETITTVTNIALALVPLVEAAFSGRYTALLPVTNKS